MKTFVKKLSFCLLMIAAIGTLESCSNAHWGTSMGMNMSFGPGGPRVTPSFNVGVYSGGRY
ncbi:hypothetical protein [Fulvivirga sedimenti]|uniref:Lipoprotein n=1 Tax=Fulvivirga sedimenti TaxID=2879465 RepID=A0A9X1KZ82_9BACT|nr:hypothetical protein [Fulvivirga sedimenti]MCA6074785.1 hypothetical protein [Fulvivirga sedimenti]MCA6075962.1 hypothetical protein [Fulvivirga sedimenti]MCA6077090.1 hypothetical protein [Fulvivirga sedimenti]